MDAVWPGQAVEENNLTVQMSTLRRVLDAGRAEGSHIETVPGRGYRFIELVGPRMEPGDDAIIHPGEATAGSDSGAEPGRQTAEHRKAWPWVAVAICVAIVSTTAVWANHWFDRQIPPRFSLAVLPFVYRGADPDRRHLADDVTVDLTTDLTQDPQATVASEAAADTYRGRAVAPREVGRALNVRYAITGGLREDGAAIRLDVHLASTESGTELWSDRFEGSADGSGAVQEQIAARLRGGLQAALVQLESARSQRERPDTPDAFDVFLRARKLQLTEISEDMSTKELDLLERSLALDPSYWPALAASAYYLVEWRIPQGTFGEIRRAETRLRKAREIAPKALGPAYVQMFWLKNVGRCAEVIEIGRQLLRDDPAGVRLNPGIYSQLGQCLTSERTCGRRHRLAA